MHNSEMAEYDEMSEAALLRAVSRNPPETPRWIQANAELNRRAAAKRSESGVTPRAREVSDPLSDVTRRERRTLLLVSVVLLAITSGDLVPTQVQSLGIVVEARQQSRLLAVLGVVEIYLLVAFFIYARVDLAAWRTDYQWYVREKARAIRSEMDRAEADGTATREVFERMLIAEWPSSDVYQIRTWFELWIPIVVGLFTCGVVALRVGAII